MLDTHQSKPFIGVRFVLFGFESNNQLQVKSKLINGGGAEADHYGQDCTHVIVDNIIYDDYVCIAARNDSKIVVTGLWVDHSFDIGVPVDHTSIMYRPLKDLNGIPGAKSLVMCLTGYLRQDRDDVMTMVGLMGAQFSKPLVANKVTHLICYKFEGGKYELAKKMNTKLVNHQWLADCLSHWQVIPEANYSESGYELEMKSEVKDSEDEAEDHIAMQFRGMKMNLSPRKIKTEISSPHSLYTPVGVQSKILLDTNVSMSNVTNHEDMQSVTIKDTSSSKTSSLNMLTEKTPNTMIAHRPDHFHGTPVSIKVENDLTCSSESAKKTCSSGVNKFNGMTYSRRKTKASMFRPEISNNLSDILKVQSMELKTRDSLDISHNGTVLTPQKRKIDATCANSGSEKISQNALKSRSVSPSASVEVHRLELTPLTHNPSDINMGFSINNKSISQNKPSVMKSDKQSPADMFIDKYSHIGLDSVSEKAPQNSYGNSKKSTDIALGISVHEVGETQQDVDASCSQQKIIVSVKSNSFFVLRGEKDDLLSNRTEQKSFGSKQKLGMRRNTKCKGSVILDKNAFQDKNSASSVEEKRTMKYEETSTGNKFEEISCPNNLETLLKISNIDVSKSLKYIEDDTMDNQTKAADEEEDDELEKLENQRSAVPLLIQNLDSMMEETSDVREHIINPSINNATSMWGDHEKEADATRIKEGKSIFVKNIVQEKMLKRQKLTINTEKICQKSEIVKKEPNNAAIKNKNNMVAASKLKNSVALEKLNKPKIIDSKSMVGNKQCSKSATTTKMALKCNRKALKMIQNDVEVDLKSLQDKEVPNKVKSEPMWFILSGNSLQKKEFQKNIKLLKGKICRDSHQWSYQATHLIIPDPVRRTEKFLAAAASGRWILKFDYLRDSNQAGKFLPEKPYEWHQNGLSEDGAINFEAPRKWRLLREKTGHGAFYGMRIIIYGDCIAPPLDTLKRAVKAGDGTILATSPPYTKFLNSGVDFAVVSPEMTRADIWVQEFLKHEVPCVVADYLVEYVCKPGYSIERHVQFNTHSWAEKSLALMMSRSEQIAEDK